MFGSLFISKYVSFKHFDAVWKIAAGRQFDMPDIGVFNLSRMARMGTPVSVIKNNDWVVATPSRHFLTHTVVVVVVVYVLRNILKFFFTIEVIVCNNTLKCFFKLNCYYGFTCLITTIIRVILPYEQSFIWSLEPRYIENYR